MTNATGFTHDFIIDNHGTIFLVSPCSDAARAFLDAHVAEDAQWFAGQLVVEHRYIGDFVTQLVSDGWVVR